MNATQKMLEAKLGLFSSQQPKVMLFTHMFILKRSENG